jgi:hypothetical protein
VTLPSAALLLLLSPVFLTSSLLPQDPPPPQPKHKIEIKLTIEPAGERWHFRLSGSTDLPDEVTIKLRVFAIEIVTVLGESREEEEGLTYKPGQWFKTIHPKNGKFDEVAFDTPRKPYSLPYRGRAYYEVEGQDEELAKKIADQDFSAKHDLAFGDPKAFDAELRESAKSIAADLDVVQRLFTDLKNSFTLQRATFDPKVWADFKKDWTARVQKLREKNDDRWELWAAWVERQGRFRIDGFCDTFRYLLEDECAAFLEKGDADALVLAQRTIDSFSARFEEAREIVGLDAPFEIEKVTAITKRYAQAIDALKKLGGKEWPGGDGHRATARDAILSLSDQKLVPRRGYERVVRLAGAWLKLQETGPDAASKPEAWKKAVDEHDAALRDFMNYAQIKP